MPVFHGFQVYKAHNCMSFTAKILVNRKSPLIDLIKYSIKDLDQLLDSYKIFEGYLERKKSEGYQEYNEKTKYFREDYYEYKIDSYIS